MSVRLSNREQAQDQLLRQQPTHSPDHTHFSPMLWLWRTPNSHDVITQQREGQPHQSCEAMAFNVTHIMCQARTSPGFRPGLMHDVWQCIFTLHTCARSKVISLSICHCCRRHKIARSRDIDIWVNCKHNQTGEKLAWFCFKSTTQARIATNISTTPTVDHVLSAHVHNYLYADWQIQHVGYVLYRALVFKVIVLHVQLTGTCKSWSTGVGRRWMDV